MQPDETLAALLEYVEVDSSPQTVEQLLSQGDQDLPELPGATGDPALVRYPQDNSEDPKDTIGRWKRRGGDSREDLYWDPFGEVLERVRLHEVGLVQTDRRQQRSSPTHLTLLLLFVCE